MFHSMPIDIGPLASIAEAAIEAARVYPGQTVNMDSGRSVTNTLDFPAVSPGRAIYPAIWIQDFTMSCSSGFISQGDALKHLTLIASCQNGPEGREKTSGAYVPPYAIPDHILFDGSPVFYPGTYSCKGNQGGEPWGILPPVNNHYDFIWLAYQCFVRSGRLDIFDVDIAGMPLLKRLFYAFDVPQSDTTTGMVTTDAARRAVGFIFCDSIYMTGHLLFASLLRWRAARQLEDITMALGLGDTARKYSAIASKIRKHLPQVFSTPETCGGWLRASTGVSSQADAWGTIYALYQGLLEGDVKDSAQSELLKSIADKQLLLEGAVRHVPLNYGVTPGGCWEKTITPVNKYQNGAYWHTPTGWLVYVLFEFSPEVAMQVYSEYIEHLTKEDFRQGGSYNAPWECIGWSGTANQNPVFAPSVSLPYAVLSCQPGTRMNEQ